ncbi:hypothetical protein [Dictyoglomus thermophilum]|uniref:hypothetical protein n=1 Tax=Dictyoglomus thermophilum TaxID=14 RepID=UPI001181398E|nr:hypothetical protein [Dictyoglomus thermophilum]
MNKIIGVILESPEFKTLVLENFISANTKAIDLVEEVEYKKQNDNLILINGEDIEILLNDNIVNGTIMLVSENFRSLATKEIPTLGKLAQDYRMEIKDNKFEVVYRNPKYTSKLISFLIYRKIGIVPSDLLVEKLSTLLQDNIPQNFEKLELKIEKFGKYILPNKILLSIKLIIDGKVNYYLLKYERGRWSIKSINLQKGSINFFHKLLVQLTESVGVFLSSKGWFYRLVDTFRKIDKFITSNAFLKYSILIFALIVGVYIVLKVRLLLILLFLYILWLLYKRFCLFLVFNREVDYYGRLQRGRS